MSENRRNSVHSYDSLTLCDDASMMLPNSERSSMSPADMDRFDENAAKKDRSPVQMMKKFFSENQPRTSIHDTGVPHHTKGKAPTNTVDAS